MVHTVLKPPPPITESMAGLYYRSEGYARTGYWIPGRDGKGGWRRPGDSSAAAAVAVVVAHRKWVFKNYQILCFLTHVRDLDALLPGNCSQFRCGSFLFSKKMDFSKTNLNTLQKIGISQELFLLRRRFVLAHVFCFALPSGLV